MVEFSKLSYRIEPIMLNDGRICLLLPFTKLRVSTFWSQSHAWASNDYFQLPVTLPWIQSNWFPTFAQPLDNIFENNFQKQFSTSFKNKNIFQKLMYLKLIFCVFKIFIIFMQLILDDPHVINLPIEARK